MVHANFTDGTTATVQFWIAEKSAIRASGFALVEGLMVNVDRHPEFTGYTAL